MVIPPKKSNIYVNEELQRALKYHQSGQLKEAEEIYNKILVVNPHHSDSLHLLGLIAQQAGKCDLAVDLIRKAIQNNPGSPVYYCNLGNVLLEQRRFEDAISSYKNALQLKPDYVDVYYNMGNAFRANYRLDEAISYYKKTIQLRPDYVNAHYNMGLSLQDIGKLDETISCYQKVLQLKPDYVGAHNNMGNAYKNQGKLNEALTYYHQAIQVHPDDAGAYVNMGNLYRDQSKLSEAVSCYQKALQIRPDPGVEVKIAMLLPAICESKESIKLCRIKLIEQIESLKNRGLALEDPHRQVGYTNFYFAYHGLNDIEIQKQISSFYIKACPDLEWISPSYNKRQRDGKIRIGIISNHFYDHTIAKLYGGIIKNLSRDKFQVVLFRFLGGKEDSVSKEINRSADEVVFLPPKLATARQKIDSYTLDILFYLDIGMEPLTYFLAFSRLAPVQCVTWGHPVTTGIPNMDYFISSESAEPLNAKEHYTECLFLPKRLVTYFYRQEQPKEISSREKFRLSGDYNLYVCPQSIFKFHPDFDDILGKILRQDPKGLLVLIEGKYKHITETLFERFKKVFPDEIDRVRFLPAMPKEDFLSLVIVADAVLDTPFFGGGNTSLEAFICGVPVVTLPGRFLRDRLTLALYKQMGIMDCIAKDAQSYIEIAFRLANDKTWRDKIKKNIVDRSGVLYEDIEAVRELEHFFESAVEKARE